MIKFSKYEEVLEWDEFAKELNFPEDEKSVIKKAYDIARKINENTKRKSTANYFSHTLFVARVVNKLGMDYYTICLALLHHAKDIDLTQFPEEVRELKFYFDRLHELKDQVKEYGFNKRIFRNYIIATAYDLRVLIVELANKLHNLLTAKYISEEYAKQCAEDVLEIYAVIANKIEINELKVPLEDYSLKILYPKTYEELKEKIAKSKTERVNQINKIIDEIKVLMNEEEISARVFGRAKHFYSIFKKIENKHKKLEEIYDLYAVRIITKTVEDAYNALEVIHSHYTPLPNRFKDYIASPKESGYQSIHTTVKKGKIVFEVQIRTEEMDASAEFGVAAHWRYKNIDVGLFDKYLNLNRQVLEVLRKTKGKEKSYFNDIDFDMFNNHFFVFTPKGDPINLINGSTVLDFAFKIHTGLGLHSKYAKVNGKKKPLNYELLPGDIVEIIPSPQPQIKEKWLTYAKSTSAKTHIRRYLGLHLSSKNRNEEENININNLIDFDEKFKIAGCCKDIKYGDEIVALKTKSGWNIHKKNCENVLPGYKYVKVRWKEIYKDIVIEGLDEEGILLKILNVLKNAKIKVYKVEAKTFRDSSFEIKIVISNEPNKKLNEVIKEIKEKSQNIKHVKIKNDYEIS